jgi:hypothetical protein
MTGLGNHTTVVALRPGTEGSVIVGLRNHADHTEQATPALPGRTIGSIVRLNALEEEVASLPLELPLELPARQTIWLRVSFTPI